MQAIRELRESMERKFNPSQTPRGRMEANRQIGKKVGEIVEAMFAKYPSEPLKAVNGRISFKALFEELYQKPYDADLVESLDHTAFPIVTGQIVSKTVIAAYEAYPKSGLSMVTVIPGTIPDEEKVAGFTTVGTLKTVGSTEAYQYITPPAEKYKRVRKIKRGGLLAINEDIIKFDRTGQYLGRCAGIGEEVARDQDARIMNGLIDTDSNVYDEGALFASPSATGGTNGNAWTGSITALDSPGFENIDQILETATDEQGRPIWVKGDRPILMVPAGLKSKARKLKLNDFSALGTANLDTNLAKDAFDFVVNPYMTTPLTSARWLYGSPKRQFVWVEDIPLQVMQRGGTMTELGWHNDIIVEHKVRYQGGIGAVDTKFWHNLQGS